MTLVLSVVVTLVCGDDTCLVCGDDTCVVCGDDTCLVDAEFDSAKIQHNLEYLQKLKSLKVDLTRYLVNQQPTPVTHELQVAPPGGETHSNVNWLKQAFTCHRTSTLG